MRRGSKGQAAYEAVCADPKAGWSRIAQRIGAASANATGMAARRYAERTGRPWPPRERPRRVPEEGPVGSRAYRWMVAHPGASWPECGEALGADQPERTRDRAYSWAKANGAEWPPPGTRAATRGGGGRAEQVLAWMREHPGREWSDAAEACGLPSGRVARQTAYAYVRRKGGTWPPEGAETAGQLRRMEGSRGRKAYEAADSGPAASWQEVEAQCGIPRARAVAAAYAARQGLPWPPPGLAAREPQGDVIYRLKEASPERPWREIADEVGLEEGRAAGYARRYAKAEGRPWPIPGSRSRARSRRTSQAGGATREETQAAAAAPGTDAGPRSGSTRAPAGQGPGPAARGGSERRSRAEEGGRPGSAAGGPRHSPEEQAGIVARCLAFHEARPEAGWRQVAEAWGEGYSAEWIERQCSTLKRLRAAGAPSTRAAARAAPRPPTPERVRRSRRLAEGEQEAFTPLRRRCSRCDAPMTTTRERRMLCASCFHGSAGQSGVDRYVDWR